MGVSMRLALIFIDRGGLFITEILINEQIRDKEVRLLDTDGAQLGIFPIKEAQMLADIKQLDLVSIAPAAKPPVCKIMDYSKYKFEQEKKLKEARKKQKSFDLKELRLSPNIDTHDINVKLKKAVEFLKNGDKVKVTVRFRNWRELARTETAYAILKQFAEDISEFGIVEKPAKLEGRNLIMFLAPHPQK